MQTLPSLHDVPSAKTGFEHTPLAGLHTPTEWHWSNAVHVTVVPPVQTPAVQVSELVQAFPSLHVVPLASTGFEHAPVDGLQIPTA